MLTARGFSFLLTVLILLAVALWTGTTSLALMCLTLLFWLLGAWLLFAVRIRLLTGRLRVARQISNEHGPVQSLWAGSTFRVRVRLRSSLPFPSPWLRVADRIPYGAECVAGALYADGSIAAEDPLEIDYSLSCLAPGLLRFEGVAVELADVQGLFYHALFLADVRHYRVLPALADARGRIPAVKRHNLLPLLGAHQHRRPGTGSELLDLRDYLPGDPPRTIAWKVSARRDRLITKEFESEVPIRCTFFMDVSQSVRVGNPGENALARLVEITASVAQVTAGARDLTGLCLFDERGVQYIRPARGARHLVQLLNLLAEVAGLPPTAGAVSVETLLRLAYGFAREVYPHLLHPDVNAFPAWLPWLSPQPAYTLRTPQLRAGSLLDLPRVWLQSFVYHCGRWLRQALLARLSARRRRHYRWRKQLAALLSVRHGLGPGGLSLLLEDDERFVLALQRFLGEHHVPYALPLYAEDGRYLFAVPGKVEILAGALLRAIARGRDNELFVLLADVLELEDQLSPLLRAVKVALARHHQVMVVCPWPPGIPLPAKVPLAGGKSAEGRRPPPDPLLALVGDTATRHFHRAYEQIRRAFGRLGVVVLSAREGESVQLILDRLERLRGQARGVR